MITELFSRDGFVITTTEPEGVAMRWTLPDAIVKRDGTPVGSTSVMLTPSQAMEIGGALIGYVMALQGDLSPIRAAMPLLDHLMSAGMKWNPEKFKELSSDPQKAAEAIAALSEKLTPERNN